MNGEPFHFLILSGYADFDYARQAMGFGVDGYLLKPVDEEEMTTELKRVRRSIESEKEDGKWGNPPAHESDWIEILLFPVQEDRANRGALEHSDPLHGGTEQAEHHGKHPAPPSLDWRSYQVVLLDLRIPDWDRQSSAVGSKAAANGNVRGAGQGDCIRGRNIYRLATSLHGGHRRKCCSIAGFLATGAKAVGNENIRSCW